MIKSNKKIILMISLMMCLLMLSGCQSANSSKEDESKSVSINEMEISGDKNGNEVNEDEVEGDERNSITSNASNIQPNENTEVMVYVIDVESDEIIPVTALIPSIKEVTPDVIVEKVVEAMADQSLDIGIDSVTVEGDTVIVSFLSDKAPVMNVGSGYEAAILNAIAQSIIDNLVEYKNVVYRIEGNAYITGHLSLEIDEVYLGVN